jgi:hypothetical protein
MFINIYVLKEENTALLQVSLFIHTTIKWYLRSGGERDTVHHIKRQERQEHNYVAGEKEIWIINMSIKVFYHVA